LIYNEMRSDFVVNIGGKGSERRVREWANRRSPISSSPVRVTMGEKELTKKMKKWKLTASGL